MFKFLAWSSISQSVSQRAFSLLEIRFQRLSGFESCIQQKKTSPFDSKIACPCHSIEINTSKHVYHQSHVRMPNGSGVERADCSLIIGTGCFVKVFSLILDSSVGLSVAIESAGDSVPETLWVRLMHSAEEDNLSPFHPKIACLCQSIEINNTKHVCMHSLSPMPRWPQFPWAYSKHLKIHRFDVNTIVFVKPSQQATKISARVYGHPLPSDIQYC